MTHPDRAFGPPGAPASVPLAIVQHGNQHLVTDGYDSREGISQVLDGFATVFALHLKHRVPLNLHLSGIFLESVAWHAPAFFGWIDALRGEGLLELLGSSYAQNVLTLCSPEHARRQIDEALWLYERHLGAAPELTRGFWVPERVWDTERVAPLVADPRLANGGYRYVLLDDRLAYGAAERAQFDRASTPARWGLPTDPCPEKPGKALPPASPSVGKEAGRPSVEEPSADDGRHLVPCRIEGGRGLVALWISGALRYCIPPRSVEDWHALGEHLRGARTVGGDGIAVYADDLEKSAGLGSWSAGMWTRDGVAPYERLLEWLGSERDVRAVLLSEWLAAHPPAAERPIERGTFYELAHRMGAGEDYRGWWESAAWAPYRRRLVEAEELLRAAPGRDGLWELAWKQLMACSYEPAWHAREADGAYRPAPWSRALAAHAASVFVIAAAAAWRERRDGRAHLERLDLDRDGEEEVVLKNDHLYALLTPRFGGRLAYLFELTDEGGRLVVGNPADDWNWQEQTNRFMDRPRNHPGAFAEVEHENDRWHLAAARADDRGVAVELLNVEEGCALSGATKEFALGASSRALDVRYRLPEAPERLAIEVACSPDYLALLREGRNAIRGLATAGARGWRNDACAVWLALGRADPVLWEEPPPRCGHGMVLRFAAYGRSFSARLGVGAADVPASDASVPEPETAAVAREAP